MSRKGYIFRNRYFTLKEIEAIKDIIQTHWAKGRTTIARLVCQHLNWRQSNGRLKETACLEALRKMAQRGLLSLPPTNNRGGYRPLKLLNIQTTFFDERNTLLTEVNVPLRNLRFKLVKNKEEKRQWRYLIQTYHYLGYQRLVGRYLQYFAYLDENLVALLGFADGIYHHRLRDNWIGWSKQAQQNNRHLIPD